METGTPKLNKLTGVIKSSYLLHVTTNVMENTAQTNARVQHLASFMQRATSYIEEAKKHEREENFDSAIINYTNALELFEIIQKSKCHVDTPAKIT
jgi:hypothetical protein